MSGVWIVCSVDSHTIGTHAACAVVCNRKTGNKWRTLEVRVVRRRPSGPTPAKVLGFSICVALMHRPVASLLDIIKYEDLSNRLLSPGQTQGK